MTGEIPNRQLDLFDGVYKDSGVCLQCGAPLPADYGNARKYCSTKCKRAAGLTDGRLGHIKDMNNRMSKVKDYVYQAYDYKCAICGWQLEDHPVKGKSGWLHSRGCEIHHIVPVAEGGNDSAQNLILLCPNCHKAANEGLIEAEDLKNLTRPFSEFPLWQTDYQRAWAKSFSAKTHEYCLARTITVIGTVFAHNFHEAVLILNNDERHDTAFREQMLLYRGDWTYACHEDGSLVTPDVPELMEEDA